MKRTIELKITNEYGSSSSTYAYECDENYERYLQLKYYIDILNIELDKQLIKSQANHIMIKNISKMIMKKCEDFEFQDSQKALRGLNGITRNNS